MHNPLRSEREAFRLVVVIGLAAGSVIALALLTRPAIGAGWGALLIGVGIGLAWRESRGTERGKAEIARGTGDRHRLLVIANQTVAGKALVSEIQNRCKGRRSEILVVVPALPGSKLQHWASDTDEAVEAARQRLAESLGSIEAVGLSARGEVGDSDPNVAIGDALREFAADEVIISTHPPQKSKWLERGVVERAREEVDLPVSHVVVDLEAEAAVPAS